MTRSAEPKPAERDGRRAANGMPDVASRDVQHAQGTLDWVGMGNIRQPIDIRDGESVRSVEARVQVFVDLADAQAKGIHMSRLYLIVDEHAAARPLSCAGMKLLLSSLMASHRDLSGRAFVEFAFDYVLRRRALVTEHAGWNSYPVTLRGTVRRRRLRPRTPRSASGTPAPARPPPPWRGSSSSNASSAISAPRARSPPRT